VQRRCAMEVEKEVARREVEKEVVRREVEGAVLA
jgi:hypothetical protein